MKKCLLFCYTSLICATAATAQTNDSPAAINTVPDKLAPKELAIPTAPLFDLMGVAPNQVARSTDIKDFKVDWSFKSWRLSPNIAMQAQPVWQLCYNRRGIERYQKSNYLLRSLASIDLSAGTVQNESGDRRIGGAIKMNLYKQKDPLLLRGAYDEIQLQFAEELKQLKQTEKNLLKELQSTANPEQKAALRSQLAENDLALVTYYQRRNESLQNKARTFAADNWNAAFIDIAAGKIFTYSTDSNESLKSLKLNRNTASGVWLNAGFGIGRRLLLSGLVRSSFYEEELNFNLVDTSTSDTLSQKKVAANKLLSYGINLRYGGPIYNFFIEFLSEVKTLKTARQALDDVFKTPEGTAIVAGSVKWDEVPPYTINCGGDWRISRNVVLNYGVRAILDKNFKTKTFLPIVNISCMMR
jgi:hypothetical protein